MPGTLYVVATPIGNLGDLSPRAAQVLQQADFVAAEDTRVTVKLLNHLGLKKPMVSYYEHNAAARGEQILDRIAAGESCALCSDAGTPAISDPGQLLVAEAMARGITVTAVPGACAAIAALAVSGQATGRFVFEGFLPMNRRTRAQRLQQLQGEERTLVLYEAPHKLRATLDDLVEAFGGGRGITLCRELTKLHEEVVATTLAGAVAMYAEKPPKGEYVLVVAGAAPPPAQAVSLEEAVELALGLAEEQDLSASEAARQAAKESGWPKGQIYKKMQEPPKNDR